MKIKDLLPILPKYSDNSGYYVKVNYINIITISEDRAGNKKYNKHYNDIFLNSAGEMFDCEVKEITSGKSLVNGGYDDYLQIWLDTEEFAEIKDYTTPEEKEKKRIADKKWIEYMKSVNRKSSI